MCSLERERQGLTELDVAREPVGELGDEHAVELERAVGGRGRGGAAERRPRDAVQLAQDRLVGGEGGADHCRSSMSQ